MSMTLEVIRKFVEEDHKDDVILITCDNEHKFYDNAYGNPPIIWDWENNCFTAYQTNQEIMDQNGHPFEVTTVSLDEIQFLTAFIDIRKMLEFANSIKDEEKKKQVMNMISRCKPAVMTPNTLRKTNSDYKDIK